MDYRSALTTIAEEGCREIFLPEAVNDETRPRYEREAIGTRVAQWAQWDGLYIAEIFRAALEDANYHAYAAVVQDWIEDMS